MLFRVQKDKENPYVMMNRSFFRDESLSAKAKGILGYILTLPDDWQIYLNELTKHFTDGRDSIRSGINELIEKGYIIRSRIRNERGHLKEYIYDVYEVSTKNGKSNLGESYSGNSCIGKPDTTKYSTVQNNNRQNNNTHTTQKTLCVEIENVVGQKPTQTAVKNLLKQSDIETIKQYLSDWDKYKGFEDDEKNPLAWFIHCVSTRRPVPKQSKSEGVDFMQLAKKPQYANFEQREYTEDEYEKFYANLNE